MFDKSSGATVDARNYVQSAPSPQPMSRIDSETERVRNMTMMVWNANERIMRHAHSLGFYVPTPEGKALGGSGTLQSTPITLHDAIEQLEQAITITSGSLNVFD